MFNKNWKKGIQLCCVLATTCVGSIILQTSEALAGFTVVNRSSYDVVFAKAYIMGNSCGSPGDLAVCVDRREASARGWWSISPGEQTTLISAPRGRRLGKNWVHMHYQNATESLVVPRSYDETREFCIHPNPEYRITDHIGRSSGNSNKFELSRKYDFTMSNGQAAIGHRLVRRGNTCESLGGEWRRFYLLDGETNFTVN